MTNEFIEKGYRKFVKRDGDRLTICQYQLRITKDKSDDGYVIAERIDE